VTVLHVVGWVHVLDGRLLTVRARGRDRLYLPGGKLEPGETAAQAVVREVREELGVALSAPRLLGSVSAPGHDQPPGTVIAMSCFAGSPSGPPRALGEVDEVVWASADPELLAPATFAAFTAYGCTI
jgi:8-oxo-dGTP diphosphatase